MNIIQFQWEHLLLLEPQDSQRDEIDNSSLKELRTYGLSSPAYTAVHKGRIVACAGILGLGDEVGVFWCFLAKAAAPFMLRFSRMAPDMIGMCQQKSVVALAMGDFSPSTRWLRMLGFTVDGSRVPITARGKQFDWYKLGD